MGHEYVRKQYTGGAPATTITGSITNVSASITIASSTGWPSGVTPFVIALDRGTVSEEKLLVTRTGATLTVVERGYDGTTALAHSSGAAAEHVLDAETLDQVNRLANLLGFKGDVFVFNGTNPIALSLGAAVDAGGADDNKIMRMHQAASGGWILDFPERIPVDASPPNASTARYGAYFDTTLDALFVTPNASDWSAAGRVFTFTSKAARDSAIGSPWDGCAVQVAGGTAVVFAIYGDGTWHQQGVGTFDDATVRDAYYDGGEYAGLLAYTIDDGVLWMFRVHEWIRHNIKVTVADSQPADPQLNDLWFQPISAE